ncbi:MAG: DUF4249 domain-containing protein [Cyclobacteriaceae bacterium]
MKTLNHSFIACMAMALFSCLDPFDPNISDSNKEFLVVDGIITNQPGPYTVKVAKSTSIEGESPQLTGMEISIEEIGGSRETLIETSNGIYQTQALQGELGKSYRLNIEYNGSLYQSTWETIHPSPTIDSVYFVSESRGTTDKDNDLDGVQFFIDSHGDEDGTRYFRYEWDETWRIGVRWPSFFDYVANDTVVFTSNPRYDCWKYASPAGINIATTNGLSKNVLSQHPLGFMTADGERFTRRYSLLVKQYALAEKEYLFWKNLQESNEELGSLFDRQPAKVLGNITNTGNSDELILGYFSASGVQEQRIFVSPSEVLPSLTLRPPCLDLDSLFKSELGDEYEATLVGELDLGKYFFDFIYSDFAIEPIGALVSPSNCSDCTTKGGYLTKPEFWDE